MIRYLIKKYKVRELQATLNVMQFGQSKMRTLSVIVYHLYLISRIVFKKLFGVRL